MNTDADEFWTNVNDINNNDLKKLVHKNMKEYINEKIDWKALFMNFLYESLRINLNKRFLNNQKIKLALK
jgi:hypothetical protein